ncbi:MAG: hypothetical protein JNM17_10425 [Archangium sp.]|nr:hypothetical protein [Archangium sp.]
MKHEADWLGPIHEIADGQSIVFERGFLSALRLESNEVALALKKVRPELVED